MSESSPYAPDEQAGVRRATNAWPWVAVAVTFAVITAGLALVLRRGGNDGGDLPTIPLADNSSVAPELALAGADVAGGGVTYELGGTIPDLGSEAPVYRMVQPELTDPNVVDLAAQVGIEGTVETTGGTRSVRGDGDVLEVTDAPGAWFVHYGQGVEIGVAIPPPEATATTIPEVTATIGTDTRTGPPPVAAPEAPPEDEAVVIAEQFITDWGVIDGPTDSIAEPSGIAAAAIACVVGQPCPDASAEAVTTHWSVSVRPTLAGVPADGLAWYVTVGPGGVVEGASGWLTDLDELGTYPLRRPESVFDDLASGTGVRPDQGFPSIGAPVAMDLPAVQAVPPVADAGEPETLEGSAGGASAGTGCVAAVETDGATTITAPLPPDCLPPPACDPVSEGCLPPTCVIDETGETCSGFEPPDEPIDPPATVVVCPDDQSTPDCTVSVDPAPMPAPGPEPVTITITGAERSFGVFSAWENGAPAAYLLPTYVFLGTSSAGGTDVREALAAIDRRYLDRVQPGEPTTSSTGPTVTVTAVPAPAPVPQTLQVDPLFPTTSLPAPTSTSAPPAEPGPKPNGK